MSLLCGRFPGQPEKQQTERHCPKMNRHGLFFLLVASCKSIAKTRRKSKSKAQYRFLFLKPIGNQMVVKVEYRFFTIPLPLLSSPISLIPNTQVA